MDGVTRLSPAAQTLAPGTYDLGLANSFMYQNGSMCRLFYDSLTASPNAAWQVFSATGVCPNGPFVRDNNGLPLTTFQPKSGSYGVPSIQNLNGAPNYWNLANLSTSYIPSDIYHSCDLVLGWVQFANSGNAIINHRAPAYDQVGDPWAMDLAGVGSIFADEENNSTPYAQISLWTTTGPLASLPCP